MKRMKLISSSLSLLALLVISPIYGQITTLQVDELVQKAMKEFNVAGVAIAIVKDGKIIHKKGYGVASIDSKKPISESTNFQIGSNSKAFTTTALAILVEEGKLKWKDKVKKYIPEFKMYNDYVTENFLIEDLLTHRSGLGLGVGDLMFFVDGSDFTIKDIVTSFQYFEPVSAFRTEFDYDNLLYIVAGEVIARASGISWEKFVQTRIMHSLKMENSFTSVSALEDNFNVATPHSIKDGKITSIPLYKNQLVGPAGGIFSNVEDMSKWMLVHLNKGKYGQDLKTELFTNKSQRKMWTIHTVLNAYNEPRYNEHFKGYGLGWDLSDINGNLKVGHTGGLPGMISMVTMIADLNFGIVVLTNTGGGGSSVTRAVSKTIMDRYLGLSDFDWIEKYTQDSKKWQNTGDPVTENIWATVASNKNTPLKSENYIGIYEDNWFGKVEVFLKNNKLWFKSFRSPKLNGEMQFYKANTFAIKWEYQNMNADALAMFMLNEEGKAQSIKMKGISPNIDFSFDFQDLSFQRIK